MNRADMHKQLAFYLEAYPNLYDSNAQLRVELAAVIAERDALRREIAASRLELYRLSREVQDYAAAVRVYSITAPNPSDMQEHP